MEKSDQNQHIAASAATAVAVIAKDDSQEEPPPYLKVIADCWEHIFDYLSFENIINMGQTCKRMNQMAGFYVREYHPQLDFELIGNEICYEGLTMKTDFHRFIGRLTIRSANELEFLSNVPTFDALKTLVFNECKSNETQFQGMQNILKNVENIKLIECNTTDNTFKQIANHCPKLKQVHVYRCKVNDSLFSQYYPTLEHVKFRPLECTQIDELKIFLEKHTKLKEFEMDIEFLWANRDVFLLANIHLDSLKLQFNTIMHAEAFVQCTELLKALHERSFYKTLQLSSVTGIIGINRELLTNKISSLPALGKLTILTNLFIDLSRLTSLKELNIQMFHTSTNVETVARSLPKLERLVLQVAGLNCDKIFPFICHSKRLKTIEIFAMYGTNLDLFALNQERKKLENACQVSIYIRDRTYLPIKWKSHRVSSELDLIKIVRLDYFDLYEYI